MKVCGEQDGYLRSVKISPSMLSYKLDRVNCNFAVEKKAKEKPSDQFFSQGNKEASPVVVQTNVIRVLIWYNIEGGGEGDDRGWDGWMASLTRWTWVWVSSRSWWWTGRPGVLLQSTGLQRVSHDWATGLNWWCNKKDPLRMWYSC